MAKADMKNVLINDAANTLHIDEVSSVCLSIIRSVVILKQYSLNLTCVKCRWVAVFSRTIRLAFNIGHLNLCRIFFIAKTKAHR